MRTRVVVLVPLVLLAAVIVWGSVRSGADAARDGAIPTAASVTSPAGTVLGNGFTVPTGASLVGQPLPFAPLFPSTGGPPLQFKGWRAVLLVSGDPRTAVDALAAEAEHAGMDMAMGCRGPEIAGAAPSFECGGTGRSDDGRRMVGVSFYRGATSYGPASHLFVAYLEGVRPGPTPSVGAAVVRDDPTAQAPALARRWPALARPGEYLFGADGEPTDVTTGRAPKVERGSMLAAPPGPPFTQPYNWVVVLKVDGAARDVAERYRRQFAAEPDYGEVGDVRRYELDDDVTLFAFSAESLGYADWHVEVFETRDGTWMSITAYAQT